MRTEPFISVYPDMRTPTAEEIAGMKKDMLSFRPREDESVKAADAAMLAQVAVINEIIRADMEQIEKQAAAIPPEEYADYEIRCLPNGRRFLCRRDDPYPELPPTIELGWSAWLSNPRKTISIVG